MTESYRHVYPPQNFWPILDRGRTAAMLMVMLRSIEEAKLRPVRMERREGEQTQSSAP